MTRILPPFHRADLWRTFLLRPAALCLLVTALAGLQLVQAQSAASVVAEMESRFLAQFETIDTYVVETDLYTSYNRRVEGSDPPKFESQTQIKGQGQELGGMGSASQSQYEQFYQLADHARHTGMETVDGQRCHVLRVDDPSKLESSLEGRAEHLTYYIDAGTYRPLRMQFEMKAQAGQAAPQSVTVNLKDYRSVNGLTLPWTIEIQTNLGETMSAEQRQQIKEMQEQMKQMDEEQRQMMERMMGDQMKQMQQMMSGEPISVQVQSVTVNEPLPNGVFEGGSNR